MSHPIFHLEVQVRSCHCKIKLNGFPVFDLDSPTEGATVFAPCVNPYLAGKRNTLQIEVHSTIRPSGVAARFEEASIQGRLKRFQKGEYVAPETGEVVTQFSIPEPLREEVLKLGLGFPVLFPHAFTNDVIDFSPEMYEGPEFEDEDALRDYAVRLRDLAVARDAGGLLREFEGKIKVWATAYGETEQVFSAALGQALSEFVNYPLDMNFDRDQVELHSHCGGRIWGLTQPDGEALLRTDLLPDETRHKIAVYVAPRKGALRIVR